MPMPACNYNRRRVHRRAFKSVFVNPPRPAPFKYFLDSREYARTIGCAVRQIRLWQAEWKQSGYGPGVEPIKINGAYRYRWESVTQSTEGTFMELMRHDLADFLAGKHDKEKDARNAAA
jgi:hypothetical protein